MPLLRCESISSKSPLARVSGLFCLERVTGIEPALFAWEARVLPLNDTRNVIHCKQGLEMQTASTGGCCFGVSVEKRFRLVPAPAA